MVWHICLLQKFVDSGCLTKVRNLVTLTSRDQIEMMDWSEKLKSTEMEQFF